MPHLIHNHSSKLILWYSLNLILIHQCLTTPLLQRNASNRRLLVWDDSWTVPDTTLPTPTSGMAIAIYNGVIYMMGGRTTESARQYVRYDPNGLSTMPDIENISYPFDFTNQGMIQIYLK